MGITPSLIRKHEKKSIYNFYSVAGAVPFALLYVFFKIAHGDVKTSMVWVVLTGRVVNQMGLKEDPQNFLLMYSISVNVSGQIASVIAGGLILTLVS